MTILLFRLESKTQPDHVEYRRFCDMVEEAFVTLDLEQNPSVNPKEYLITYESLCNYLTDEQRNAVDSALTKLRSKPNIGLDDLFKDYDKCRQGVVSVTEFLGALVVRKLNMLLSVYEIKCLTIAFSKEERPNTLDYRSFLRAIENL